MNLHPELERRSICRSGLGRDPNFACETIFAPRGAPTQFETDALRI